MADVRQLMRIAEIIEGDRFRKEMGDIPALADLMNQRGQVEPIVVTTDGKLIKGWRRILAAKHLGWDKIWVVVNDKIKDPVDLLLAQADTHVGAKPLTISETVAMAKVVLKLETERARERQRKGQPLSKTDEGGRSDEKVAKAFGMGKTTFRKAMEVCDALEANPENPELQKIVNRMDATNRVKGPYDDLENLRLHERNAEIRANLGDSLLRDLDSNYPVHHGRFQEVIPTITDSTVFRTVSGDLLWDEPGDYEDLAREMSERLPDDGMLIVQVGSMPEFHDEIKERMKKWLKHRLDLMYYCPGNPKFIVNLNASFNHKPIFVFCKKGCEKAAYARQIKQSVIVSPGADKRYHDWGCNVDAYKQIVELFTEIGEGVFEVCSGGGTMVEACMRLQRWCISVEDDEEDCTKIRGRIAAVAKELKLDPRVEAGAVPEELAVAELVEQGAN